jgi:hypothetical protein
LFIGIAVGEASNIVERGAFHLLKVRIDLLLRIFYLYSFFNFCNRNCLLEIFHKKYLWQVPKNKKGFWRSFKFYVFQVIWILKDKLMNQKWSVHYKVKLNGSSNLARKIANEKEEENQVSTRVEEFIETA